MTSLQQVASDAEEVLDESVHRQESLRLTRRFELSHLPLTLASRLMGDFGTVVLVLLGAMDDGRHRRPLRGAIASELVGDQPPRHVALTLQQLAKEALGGFPVATRLDENIDHVTILINRTPELLSFASDRDEDLVQVPRVTQPTLTPLQRASVFRAELEAPKPDRFVGNRDAALGEKVFYIPKAETEPVVEPYGMTDDFRWEPVSTVARCVAFHRPSLPDTVST